MQKKLTIKINPWVFAAISALCILLLIYTANTLFPPRFGGGDYYYNSIFGRAYVLQEKSFILFIPFFIINFLMCSVSFALVNSIWLGQSRLKFWLPCGVSSLIVTYCYINGRLSTMAPNGSMPKSQQIEVVQRLFANGVAFLVISLLLIFFIYCIITRKKRKTDHISPVESPIPT